LKVFGSIAEISGNSIGHGFDQSDVLCPNFAELGPEFAQSVQPIRRNYIPTLWIAGDQTLICFA
jgi:hypothetical protein